MTTINFKELKAIYKDQMDQLLAPTGLTTKCILNYSNPKKLKCPNCIYDMNLKKSSGKFKIGGLIPFAIGMICPVCNGSGTKGDTGSEELYMAVIANHKDWIIKPTNIKDPKNIIETICSKNYYQKIKKCESLTVVYSELNSNPVFMLVEDPTPAGLGETPYIICKWEKTGTSVPGAT